jgi:hypothetical protein
MAKTLDEHVRLHIAALVIALAQKDVEIEALTQKLAAASIADARRDIVARRPASAPDEEVAS